MKKFSRIGAGLLVLCLALCLLPLTVKADNEVTSGTCGDNLTWSFDPATGTLTIDGSGAMYDYYDPDTGVSVRPWDAYTREVKTIVIGPNVTAVSSDAFAHSWDVVRICSETVVKELTQPAACGSITGGTKQMWIEKSLKPHISDWLAQQFTYICEQQYAGKDYIVLSKEYLAEHTHLMASAWSSDESGHWHACHGCDEKENFEAHQYTDACDAECNTCGYIRTVTHSYSDTWSTDSEKHWHQCSVCGNRADESAHIPGPAATETSAQTCTTCGYVLQAPLGHEHSFGSAWQTDAVSHWHGCACGAKADEGSHSWDGGTVTQPPQVGQTGTRVYACTTCGAQKSEPVDALPPETDSEPAPTEPAPTEPAPATPAPTEPAPAEPTPTKANLRMLRIVKSPWTWVICGGLLLLTVLLTAMLVFEKKDPEQ